MNPTPVKTYYVFGYTDRFRQNGFPACDGPLGFEEACALLERLHELGFGYCNEAGRFGWMEEVAR